jgi:hypothetical protein
LPRSNRHNAHTALTLLPSDRAAVEALPGSRRTHLICTEIDESVGCG